MRGADEPSTDEPSTDDTSYDVGHDEGGSGSLFRYPAFGWWSFGSSDPDVNDEYRNRDSGSDDDSWVGESLVSLLILAGAVLFFFPEPATSLVGVLLMLAGVILWIADWMT